MSSRALPAASTSTCFHCGLPVPPSSRFRATIEGEERAMCCPGCVAVAELIAASGLGAYYRYREQPAATPEPPSPARRAELARYDHPALQRTFVREEAGGLRRVTLALDGLRCAACVWLVEEGLRRRPGVREIAVNLASARAELQWDGGATPLSALLAEVARLGYQARPYRPDWAEAARREEHRAAVWRLGVAGLGAMQVMMYAVALYAGALEGMSATYRDFFRWASGIVTAPVVVIAGRPFFAAAWRDLANRRPSMDVPVALAIGVTFAASLVAAWLGTGEVYFESICMFVFLLGLARFVEMRTRHRAASALEQAVRQPPACTTRLRDGGEELVSVYELVAGDLLLVKPGETIAADGEVVAGHGWVNEAMLTGEHWPRSKHPGDPVVGGTQNGESPLTVRVARTGADTVLASVIRLVDEAGRARPGIAQVADRIATLFVPRILVLAALAGLAWLWVDPARAPWIALAVLVVSCPCALSLATPVALTAAGGTLVRAGVLAARGHVLEGLGKATHVVFDKTGTLTEGRARLLRAVPVGDAGVDASLTLARLLESGSGHPIARAFASGPVPARGPRRELGELVAVAGKGIEATVDGRRYRLGAPEWAAALGRDSPRPPAERTDAREASAAPHDARSASSHLDSDERRARLAGARPACAIPGQDGPPPGGGPPSPSSTDGTWILLAADDGARCWFELDDAARPEAPAAVRALVDLGLEVHMVSGDAAVPVQRLARRLAIPTAVWRATPEEKLAHVRRLQRRGAVVVMVGDGVNDAPGLGGAQVSLAMGGGTDLARTHADAVLLREDLTVLATAVRLARRTRRVIAENLAWAVAYNAVAVPLAAVGLVTPYWAALGMSASSLLVVLNARKLARERGDGGKRASAAADGDGRGARR